MSTATELHEAAAVLAAMDTDWASDANGVGYSQADTSFGHQLAATPPDGWTDRTTRQAWEMLRTYRRQLASHGIDFDDIDEPAEPDDDVDLRRGVHVIDAADDMFLIRFPYDPTLVADVKRSVPGRRWNGARKLWSAPPDAADALTEFASRNGFGWTEEAERLVADAPESGPAGGVDVDGDLIVIRFDGYHPEKVAAVKRIRGRRWDGDRKVWLVPTTMVRDVRTLVQQHDLATTPAFDALDDVEPQVVPTVAVEGGRFLIRFPYDRDLNERVRSLPGARWAHHWTAWTVPIDSAVEVIEFVVATDGKIDGTADDVLAEARAALERIEQSKAETADIDVPNLGVTLRPFQRAGVAYADAAGYRLFLADEMGLGKTITSIALLELREAYPAVVVVPESLRLNWQRELARAVPHRTVHVAMGRTPYRVDADVTVIGYGSTVEWADELSRRDPLALVADESHYAKNRDAQRTKAVQAVSDHVWETHGDDATILCLTGTPIPNRSLELRSQLSILHRLAEFGGWSGFTKRYGGGRNDIELHRRLRATCYLRRLKVDVAKELPPKQWVPFPVEGDPDAMAEYRRAERDIIGYLAEQARQAARDAGATTEEAERAAWSKAVKASAAEHLVALGSLLRLSAAAKRSAVDQFVGRFRDEGQKLVVFGASRDVVGRVADEYADGCVIWGGQTQQARQDAVDLFQQDGDQTVIAVSIRAGGVGLTLTAASNVLFVEQDWTPAAMDQALDRCHRIGQTDSVSGYVLTIPDTVDDDMHDLLERKRQHIDGVADGVVDGEDQTGSVVTDLLIRLTERGLAATA